MKTEKEIVSKALFYGPCEKVHECHYASKACYDPLTNIPLSQLNCAPRKRWILCWGWKKTRGMFFDAETGSYVYLSKLTRRRLETLKKTEDESYDNVVQRLITEKHLK